MIDVLACPGCRGGVAEAGPDAFSCPGCGRSFPVVEGVIRMLPDAVSPAGGWGTDLPPEKYRDGERVPQLEDRRFRSGFDSRRKNDRERAIVDWFLDGRPPGFRFLDVPCGMGRLSDVAVRRGAALCSVDLNFELARYASTRVEGARPLCIQGDITALPLRDDSMEAAACIRISQYFDDAALASALKEVGRVAGDVLLTYRSSGSPVAWPRRIRKSLGGGPAAVKRYRSRRRVEELAEEAGLRPAARPPRSMFLYLTQFVRLVRREESLDRVRG